MAEDSVDLDPQEVSNGLGKWDEASSSLKSRWDQLNGQITGLLNPGTWGDDTPGNSFETSFVDQNQARQFKGIGDKVIKRVIETGQNIRSSVEGSLDADKQQASEVGGVNVPSSGGGSGGSGGGGSGGGGSGGSGGGGSGGGSSGGGSSGGGSSGGGSSGGSGGGGHSGGGGGGGGERGEYMAEIVPGSGQVVGHGEGELVAEFVGHGEAMGVAHGELMAEFVPGSGQVVGHGEGELVAEFVPGSGEVVGHGEGELVAEFVPGSGEVVGEFAPEGAPGEVTLGPAPFPQGEYVEPIYEGPSLLAEGEAVAEFIPEGDELTGGAAAPR